MSNIIASPHYTVSVKQGDIVKESFTYISKNQFPRVNVNSDDTSWTSFPFSGKATVIVEVHRHVDGGIADCRILPSRLGIEAKVEGNRIEFEIASPVKISVEINGEIRHPLLVFADPPESEPVPEPGPNVLVFPPGVHEMGRVVLQANQTVYIAEGAYVKGHFVGGDNNSNISIRGRGVLSGEGHEHKSHHMIEIIEHDPSNILIEGITIVNSPWTHIRMRGENHTIRNVKMISWYHNTDGILTGANSLIEDCFFKLNDDAIKLYHSGIVARHCVIWQLVNGAPFQLTWNVWQRTRDVVVHDCDVIRVEHRTDWDNKAVFNCIHGGTGHVSHYVFENIYIENANFRFVKLIFKKTKYNVEQIGYGKMSDITFRNIVMTEEMGQASVLSGHDEEHGISDIVFENVTMNHKPLTVDHIEFDERSVKHIKVIP